MRMFKKKTAEDIIMDSVIYLILALLAIVTFYPMWYVVVASFSSSSYIAGHEILLWPGDFNLEAYRLCFKHPLLLNSFGNSLKVLGLALPLNIVLTVMAGYFMAETTKARFKKPIIYMILFTMFFNGGLIPNYLNIKDLGLYNTIWSLVLPGALSVYNANICKTAMEGIPYSLHESAYIEGANDMQVLFKIVLPLMKPTLAVLLLYYGVAHWNAWFNASIYIRDEALLPAQNILRAVLLENATLADGAGDSYSVYAEAMQYAAIVIVTVPIVCVYPFLQKHFTKGAMIGAVKG